MKIKTPPIKNETQKDVFTPESLFSLGQKYKKFYESSMELLRKEMCKLMGWDVNCYVWYSWNLRTDKMSHYIVWNDEQGKVVTKRINKKLADKLVGELNWNHGS